MNATLDSETSPPPLFSTLRFVADSRLFPSLSPRFPFVPDATSILTLGAIERERIEKKSGKRSYEIAYGIPSPPQKQADARRVLDTNRGHWVIENSCHYIVDWNYDADRCRIRTGHGHENVTRLRRFAISVIKSKGVSNVAQKMRQLNKNTRLVFDYLRTTTNSCVPRHA